MLLGWRKLANGGTSVITDPSGGASTRLTGILWLSAKRGLVCLKQERISRMKVFFSVKLKLVAFNLCICPRSSINRNKS